MLLIIIHSSSINKSNSKNNKNNSSCLCKIADSENGNPGRALHNQLFSKVQEGCWPLGAVSKFRAGGGAAGPHGRGGTGAGSCRPAVRSWAGTSAPGQRLGLPPGTDVLYWTRYFFKTRGEEESPIHAGNPYLLVKGFSGFGTKKGSKCPKPSFAGGRTRSLGVPPPCPWHAKVQEKCD